MLILDKRKAARSPFSHGGCDQGKTGRKLADGGGCRPFCPGVQRPGDFGSVPAQEVTGSGQYVRGYQ